MYTTNTYYIFFYMTIRLHNQHIKYKTISQYHYIYKLREKTILLIFTNRHIGVQIYHKY